MEPSDLLAHAEQAQALGITPEHLSRLKRAHGYGGSRALHPYPAPVIIGGREYRPRDAVLAWHQTRPVGPRTGRPRTRPAGWTVAQWAGLVALAGGGECGPVVLRRLVAAGWATKAGRVSARGRRLVEQWI